MSMRLTREDLEQMMLVLDSLEAVPADIRQVRVGGHEVILERVEDNNKRSGVSYVIRGITDKESGTPAYRDRGSSALSPGTLRADLRR